MIEWITEGHSEWTALELADTGDHEVSTCDDVSGGLYLVRGPRMSYKVLAKLT